MNKTKIVELLKAAIAAEKMYMKSSAELDRLYRKCSLVEGRKKKYREKLTESEDCLFDTVEEMCVVRISKSRAYFVDPDGKYFFAVDAIDATETVKKRT